MNSIGHYLVGDKVIANKNTALYEANRSNANISWYFYDDIFQEFARNKKNNLGLVSLNELYRQRAQQLRDEYDYLILNYSGGPDSHNILMTFLNNKIHLDEVHVKYSNSVDSKLYNPNSIIKGAENIHSEYDLVIKPVLDQLVITNPEIKISIHDVFESKFSINDDTFITAGHFTGAFELYRQQQYSSSIDVLSERGKKIADIFGVDKPLLIYKDRCLFTFFSDVIVNVAGSRHVENQNASIELFYWTPSMPQIVIEQAYLHYMYFKMNSEQLSLIDINTITPYDPIRQELLRKLSINLIYNTWDHSKFQAEKPQYFSNRGRSRDKYYLIHNEFKKYLEIYDYHLSDWYSVLGSNKKTFYSSWINIGEL